MVEAGGRVPAEVVAVAVVAEVAVGGDRAATTAAAAAGLDAMAAISSGDKVVGLRAVGDGVLAGSVERPEWSMGADSGTGDSGRMPGTEVLGFEAGAVLCAMAMSCL